MTQKAENYTTAPAFSPRQRRGGGGGRAGSAATSGIPTPPPLPRLGLRTPPRAPRTSRQVSGIVRAPQSTNRIFANQEPRAAATLSSNTKQHSPELTQNHRAKSRHPAPRACLRPSMSSDNDASATRSLSSSTSRGDSPLGGQNQWVFPEGGLPILPNRVHLS